jgi:hypothetical protein
MTARDLRVAIYDIRKAVGTDRKRDPDTILRILGEVFCGYRGSARNRPQTAAGSTVTVARNYF